MSSAVSEMATLALAEIYINSKVETKVIDWASKSIQGCMKILSEEPKSLVRVLESLKAHPHTLRHAIMTSVFSMILVKQIGYDSERTL